MILNEKKLRETVDAEDYLEHHVPLRVKHIEGFKGGLTIDGAESNYDVPVDVRHVRGTWMLNPGVYHADFHEDFLRIKDIDTAYIYSAPHAATVGVETISGVVDPGEVNATIRVAKSVEIEDDSVLAHLVVHRPTIEPINEAPSTHEIRRDD